MLNKIIKLYFLILLSFPLISMGQEIDASILSNLTPEQLAQARELAKDTNLDQSNMQEVRIIPETLRKKVEPEDASFKDEKDEKDDEKKDMNDEECKEDETDKECEEEIELVKYGYNFFNTIPTSITAVGDLPLPNDYKISLSDELTVVFSGTEQGIIDISVKLDGTIFIPELGTISVANQTLKDVRAKLIRLVEQTYIGADIDVSIKSLSAKKITIVGAVETPGTYLVNPFSTITSALAYSGGILEFGSLRKIQLIKTNGSIFSFDLYNLLIYGDRSEDQTIDAGDTILISGANQFVELNGSVKRPAITLNLRNNSIDQSQENNLESEIKNVISVTVYDYFNKPKNGIYVQGSIGQPGFYDINKFPTLDSLIKNLNFIDTYPYLAILEQFNSDTLQQKTILFNLKDPDTYKSINLIENSKVYFLGLKDPEKEYKSIESLSEITKKLISDYTLTINHREVIYEMPVIGRFYLNSFINLLGIDMSDVEREATYISPLDDIVEVLDYQSMIYSAKKFNTVSFRSPVNSLIKVSISGAIDFPGEYTLKPNATLGDLYTLIGGFKDEAALDSIIFKRESVREKQEEALNKNRNDLNESLLANMQTEKSQMDPSVILKMSNEIDPENLGRISGDYDPLNSESIMTILLDGDSIEVPKRSNTINVLGEVLNANAFTFSKGISIEEAIANAGGFKDYANKKAIYVIRGNGLIEKPGKNLFVSRRLTLKPGDTVVVPRKLIINSPGLDFLIPITTILSDLAFAAAAVQSLSDNN